MHSGSDRVPRSVINERGDARAGWIPNMHEDEEAHRRENRGKLGANTEKEGICVIFPGMILIVLLSDDFHDMSALRHLPPPRRAVLQRPPTPSGAGSAVLGPADQEKLARQVLHEAILNRPFNQFQACERGSGTLASGRHFTIGMIGVIWVAENSTGDVSHATVLPARNCLCSLLKVLFALIFSSRRQV